MLKIKNETDTEPQPALYWKCKTWNPKSAFWPLRDSSRPNNIMSFINQTFLFALSVYKSQSLFGKAKYMDQTTHCVLTLNLTAEIKRKLSTHRSTDPLSIERSI